jgi:hypothetical protein
MTHPLHQALEEKKKAIREKVRERCIEVESTTATVSWQQIEDIVADALIDIAALSAQSENERYLETNIKSLVEEMKKDAEEYGQYHDDDCPLMREDGADIGDECECEMIRTLKSFAHEWMAKVNQRWCAYAEAHRKHCTPEGNKDITRMMGKKNRIRTTTSNTPTHD